MDQNYFELTILLEDKTSAICVKLFTTQANGFDKKILKNYIYMDTFFLANPFLLHHLSLSVQLLPKNKSVLQRLISSAASSLCQLPTTSRRRRKNFQ